MDTVDRLTEEVLKLLTLYDDEYGRGFNDALRLVLAILIKLKEEEKNERNFEEPL